MNPDRFTTSLGNLIQNSLADVHTTLPAKITSVDYGTGRASVLPLVKTQIGINKTLPYPELSSVPLVVMSGGKGRITFPVKAGDTVLVLFSERDPTNVLAGTGTEAVNPVQSNYLGLFPIGIIPCISVAGNAKSISNEDVLLENDKAKMTLKPDGTMQYNNGSANIVAQPDGNVKVNNLTITPDGNVITASGVNLNDFYQRFLNHVHSGVQSGNSNTGRPV